MKPTVQDILAAAQKALNEVVAPDVKDEFAASALRSIDVILNHLRARVPVEGPMLYEDIGDLAQVMGSVLSALGDDAGALVEPVRAYIGEAAALLASGYPAVDTLADSNIKGRGLIDELLLAARRAELQGQGKGGADAHAAIRGYLERHQAREQSFYFPTFVGRPV